MEQNKVFYSVKDTCMATGLSQYYLRQGCRAGTIPHIRVGNKIMVNVPLMLVQLEGDCRKK